MHGNANSKLRKQKLKELATLCSQYSLVGIVECHGLTTSLLQSIQIYIRSHYLFHSPTTGADVERPGTGGVAILLNFRLLYPHENLNNCPTYSSSLVKSRHFEVIVPGRIVKTTLFGRKTQNDHMSSLAAYTVHNFGLTNVQMTHVEKQITLDLRKSQSNPFQHCSILMGDFNLSPPGSVPFVLSNPIPPNRNVAPLAIASSRPFQSRWEKLFALHTEIHFPQNTHYNASSCSQNKIDRIFTSAPRSLQVLLKHNAGTIKDPIYWYSRGLSDHSPIYWSISIPQFSPSQQRFKIKKEWTMHPHYASRMSAFAPFINSEELTTAEHRDIIVKLMKETALQCRDKLFLSDPESNHSTLTRLSSISRAVWTQDLKLASILIQHSSLGQQFLSLSNDTVSCINPQEFESRYMDAKTEHFNKEREALQRDAQLDNGQTPGADRRAAKRTSQTNAINRLAALWTPRSPRLALGGLIVTEDMLQKYNLSSAELNLYRRHSHTATGTPAAVIISDPAITSQIIGYEWGKIFAEQPIDESLAEELLGEYGATKQ